MNLGRGGMVTKILAARLFKGLTIITGNEKDVLLKIAKGKTLGTLLR